LVLAGEVDEHQQAAARHGHHAEARQHGRGASPGQQDALDGEAHGKSMDVVSVLMGDEGAAERDQGHKPDVKEARLDLAQPLNAVAGPEVPRAPDDQHDRLPRPT
jgi:hypothetical protein